MNSMYGKITKNHVRLVLFHELLQDCRPLERDDYVRFYSTKLADSRRCYSPESRREWSDFSLFVRYGSFKMDGFEVLQKRPWGWTKTRNTRLRCNEIEEVKTAVITIPCEWRLSQ